MKFKQKNLNFSGKVNDNILYMYIYIREIKISKDSLNKFLANRGLLNKNNYRIVIINCYFRCRKSYFCREVLILKTEINSIKNSRLILNIKIQ